MTTTRTPVANRLQPIDPQPDALPMPNQTDKTLAQIRTELLTTFSAADWVLYSRLVGWLRDTDMASHALKPVYWFGRADTFFGPLKAG